MFTTRLLHFTPVYKLYITYAKQSYTKGVYSIPGCLLPVYSTLFPYTRYILPELNSHINWRCIQHIKVYTTRILHFTPIYKLYITYSKQSYTKGVYSIPGCLLPVYSTILPYTSYILTVLNSHILKLYTAYQGVYYPFTLLYPHIQAIYYLY